MTVGELEQFLATVPDKDMSVYLTDEGDPIHESLRVENAFVISGEAMQTGAYEGVYLTH